MTAVEDLPCQELVELVNDYLEDLLDDGTRTRFDRHLETCAPCSTYLEQMRLTVAATGRIDPAALSPGTRRSLLDAFRAWSGRNVLTGNRRPAGRRR